MPHHYLRVTENCGSSRSDRMPRRKQQGVSLGPLFGGANVGKEYGDGRLHRDAGGGGVLRVNPWPRNRVRYTWRKANHLASTTSPAASDPMRVGASPGARSTGPAVSAGRGSRRQGRPGAEAGPQKPHEIDPERGTHAAKVNERLDTPHDGSGSPASSWNPRQCLRFYHQTGESISTE
jgi:hypothetical protein